jgi:hypothetical protein
MSRWYEDRMQRGGQLSMSTLCQDGMRTGAISTQRGGQLKAGVHYVKMI